MKDLILSIGILVLFGISTGFAQTSALTYQGKLADSAVAANGAYDLTFKLYDTLVNGTQIGPDITRDDVSVSDGIFTVDLDFGAAAFANGGARFLQIEVRPGASSGTFTPLVPRQPVTSAPYSVKTIDATTADSLSPACVSCVTDTNIDTVNAGKVTGVLNQTNGGTGLNASGSVGNFLRSNGTNWTSSPFQASDIPVLGGSFIQNTTATQTSSNFAISGVGRANIFNAITQYNIGGQRVLSTPSGNLFVGEGAGTSNSGGANSFLGPNAGFSNTDGYANAFVGSSAGLLNTTGYANSFVGSSAGGFNTTGFSNSFFGASSGFHNDSGVFNAFVGYEAGRANTTGSNNSFFGSRAGYGNTTEGDNSYFGSSAGGSGFGNAFFGAIAGSNNTGSSNSFFGRASGFVNTSGGENTFFGSSSGQENTTGSNNTYLGAQAGFTNTTGSNNTTIGYRANVAANNLNYATAIGSDAIATTSNSVVLGRSVDTVRIPGNLNIAGSFSGSFTIPTTNITGVVAQANGGTGLTSPGAAGNFLRSDGTNWTSSPFQASDIPVLSTSFIQNTTTAQMSSNFNVSGTGTANVFSAGTQYNIGGNRVLSNGGTNNLFAGVGAGQSNTTGAENAFFGPDAGLANTAGGFNSFFGYQAGFENTLGFFNSFFGRASGYSTTTGANNSFFGAQAGAFNTAGDDNSFFGSGAGVSNSTGIENSFFGSGAGLYNTTGYSNSFFGTSAGQGTTTGHNNLFFGRFTGFSNTTGYGNTLIGDGANVGFDNLFNATAIGVNAVVSQNNSLVLGAFGSSGFDTKVGIGTTAPGYKLDVVGRARFKQERDFTGTQASAGFWFFQNTPNDDRAFVGMENDNSVGLYGNNGGNWGLVMNTQSGVTSLRVLGAAGNTTLCRNASNEISTCSSSLRYKTNIGSFADGMSFVNRLRPISYQWRDGGMRDVGLGAEDIAKIDPRFVTYNSNGEVEGVKYDRLSAAFVNAFKEQQAEIGNQKSVISDQQRQIDDLNSKINLQQNQLDSLKKLFCLRIESTEICKEEK